MTFYNLKQLNIRLSDFICLLSPLGVVTKIVSNGKQNLVQIEFHNDVLKNNGILIKDNEYINDSLIKLYKDNTHGFIVNDKIGILELPYGIEENSLYINKVSEKNIKNISKFVRKNIPKDCFNILSKGINIINEKCTDPNKININNIPGYKSIPV